MKTTSNLSLRSILRSLGLMVLLSAVTVSPSFAITTTKAPAKTTTTCTYNITTLTTTNTAAIAGKITDMNTDFANRLTTIGTNATALDQKMSDGRTKATATFETSIAILQKIANLTTTQKAAIKTYDTSMQAAEKTRETAVDAARTTYQKGLTDQITTHQTNLTAAASTFQTTITQDFTEAKAAACNATTLATLKANVKNARATFVTARSADKITAAIQQLATDRNTAITNANTTFTTAAKKYAATLANSLHPTPSPTATTDTDSTTGSSTDSSTSTSTTPSNTDTTSTDGTAASPPTPMTP